jgi:response regulator RpfG family c-di-GMP phosphodiesterase
LSDFESAVEAINKGHVYCYIDKPWGEDDLKAKVKSALEHRESIVCLRSIVDILADEIIKNQKDHTAIRKLAGAVSDSRRLCISHGHLSWKVVNTFGSAESDPAKN